MMLKSHDTVPLNFFPILPSPNIWDLDLKIL